MEKLNKKIAHYFKIPPKIVSNSIASDRVWVSGEEWPDYPNDIKACFEDIAPKLLSVEIKTWTCEPRASQATVWGNGCDAQGWADIPALALCRAVEKLIDGECEHAWIKVRNEVVTSGEMCSKCHAVRAELINE